MGASDTTLRLPRPATMTTTTADAVDDTPDAELVRRTAAGDRSAFDVLVKRYQKRVYAVAYGMVHGPEQALDVTQEAFAKAYQSIRTFGGRSNFYTWLYRIVVNSAIDYLRKEQRERAVPYDDRRQLDADVAAVGAQASLATPEVSARRTEAKDAIVKAIACLPPEQRAAILLREVEGLSYKEIAAVMRCSKGTVMSRLHYARRKLQTLLADDS